MKRKTLKPVLTILVAVALVFTYSSSSLPDVSASSGNGKSGKSAAPPKKIPVDKEGFDSEGRMVAYFGSPLIDGEVDKKEWKHAPKVKPKYINTDNVSATFQALWDDDAIYILAEVKDKNLSVESGTPYMQDSVEVFLDRKSVV